MKFLMLPLFFMLSLLSFVAFGQDVEPVMPTSDFIQLFLASLGGIKGASVLAIVGIVLKLLFAFLNSELAGKIGFMRDMNSGIKLFLILLISYASGIVTLMTTSDLSFGAAFIHSTSMSALIVLLNQAYKKFIEKK